MRDSPGRLIQSRLACGPHGGLAEACLDADKRAWAATGHHTSDSGAHP
jgi:hypothetical protein